MVARIIFGLASFVGGLLSKATDKLQDKAIEKAGAYFTDQVLLQSAGHFGMASNHDAAKAIRRAQMESLTCLIKTYAANVPPDEEAKQFPLLFIDPALDFAQATKLACGSEVLALSQEVIDQTIVSLDATLADIKTSRHEAPLCAQRRKTPSSRNSRPSSRTNVIRRPAVASRSRKAFACGSTTAARRQRPTTKSSDGTTVSFCLPPKR